MKNNTLGIMALFRNESGALEEFILHHLDQGVDHFYFINNDSDDDFMPIIDKYEDVITMLNQPVVLNTGEKFDLINMGIQEESYMMMLPHVKTEWLLVIDLDEFVYTRNGYHDIKEFLTKNGDGFDQIMFKLKMFNSNNHIKQPDSIIDGFTSRTDFDIYSGVLPKVIARTNKIKYITAHYCNLNDENSLTSDDCLKRSTNVYSKYVNKDDIVTIRTKYTMCKEEGLIEPFIMGNHYPVQSEEWFYNIKAKRGICGWAGSEFEEIFMYLKTYYDKLNNRRKKRRFVVSLDGKSGQIW